jgi:hypothetical protein
VEAGVAVRFARSDAAQAAGAGFNGEIEMKRLNILASVTLAAAMALSASSAFAIDVNYPGIRTGLGQETPKTPPMLGGLRLDDPLIRQKYLNDPDALRFLRGTYSEACVRGLVHDAAEQVKLDPKSQYGQKARDSAGVLLDSNRIWKMSSFEMEAIFGRGYLNAANYCDCIMEDVSNDELVDPKKGMDIVEKIPKDHQESCNRIAADKTNEQIATHPGTPAK